MIFNFNYPVMLTKQEEGGYVVRFPDFPEAITQGETKEDALQEAVDCLDEAVANRITLKLDIPIPSRPKRNQYLVSLHTTISAKSALYLVMRKNKLSNVSLAKKLNCDEKEIRRMLNPHYHSKLPRIEEALNLLGKRLEVSVVSNEPHLLRKREFSYRKVRVGLLTSKRQNKKPRRVA